MSMPGLSPHVQLRWAEDRVVWQVFSTVTVSVARLTVTSRVGLYHYEGVEGNLHEEEADVQATEGAETTTSPGSSVATWSWQPSPRLWAAKHNW